jgi:hypothetical protein
MVAASPSTVVCPGCGALGPVTLPSFVDVGADPSQKELLTSGKLLAFTCPHCSRVTRIAHPLLYVDPARGLAVQLLPEGDFDGAAALTKLAAVTIRETRLVRDGNALIEKVRVFEAGLDDRVIEVQKAMMALGSAEYKSAPLYLERVEEMGTLLFVIVTAKGPMATRRPREEYGAIAADLAARGSLGDAAPFARIDRGYALDWLGEVAAPPLPSR